jgi:long-chain acyl-CoA synthetase
MLALRTLNDILVLVAQSPERRVMLWQDAKGEWLPISGGQFCARVCALARTFLQWGVKKGDRIALIAENRWEWAVTDFAALAIGAIDVPLFPTLTAEQTAGLLANSGAEIAVVSTRKHYEKLQSVRAQTSIQKIIVMDEGADVAAEFASLRDLLPGAEATAQRLDPVIERIARAVQPDDLATLIYTSGTTAEPKGVMLTHGNIASNLNHSTERFGWDNRFSAISFLPLSHITARHVDYALFCYGATIAYCPRIEKLPGAMQVTKPTIFVAVPRVYEKLRQEVERRSSASPVKKRIFRWALRTGAGSRERILRGERPSSPAWRIADKLVYSKLRAAFGGEARDFIAGGAPLGLDLARWYADMGIRIYEGYGLTETSPVIALNNRYEHRIGSVGKPLPNVDCRIAGDGELEVRGPSIFEGYWMNPAFTEEAFTVDGWFRTGDIGRIDEDGFLYITDRKKELIKTSNGKFIAPQPIEGKLKMNALVGNVSLVGDRRKFVSAIISPDFSALEAWARQQGIAVGDREQLLGEKAVLEAFRALLAEVNATLPSFEWVKRFRLVAEEWSPETGELTPSLKLKRRVIESRYRELIASIYNDPSLPAEERI